MILFSALQVKALTLASCFFIANPFMPAPLPLVLASTSPFRRELLNRLGLPFTVCNPATDESPLANETPEALALRLAEAKARAGAVQHPNALIIGSDQVAVANGKIYGKPGNHEKAVAQLQELSGQTVNFFTGLCLFNAATGRAQVQGVPTLVTFRQLSVSDIENYLQREPAYNCAGSAKSEGLGIALLQSMTGDDPNALVGLPLIALCTMLQAEGVRIL